MRLLVTALVATLALTSATADDNGDIHAVLVAGSNSFYNYRHQADTCHSYHVLIEHGVKPENIIVMMYDDVANSWQNPYKGKLFNQPNGVDVYQGVKIDYKGNSVNPHNFEAVMKGDASATRGGNGRVLTSGKNDKVFVYFVDHGAPGLVAFPNDEFTVKQLNQTLQAMVDRQLFGQLVFYLEACESASMFEKRLPDNINILAYTASNATESSWGCYCDVPHISTCLGDLFSVNWMEDSDVEDLNKETLEKQYQVVKEKTNLSNVMVYGDKRISPEFVSIFQGHTARPHRNVLRSRISAMKSAAHSTKWNSRDIPVKTLESQLQRERDPKKRDLLVKELADLLAKRSFIDVHTRELVQKMVVDKAIAEHVLSYKAGVVNDMDCHHDVVKAYSRYCFNLGRNPYAAQAVVGALNNLCDTHMTTERIVATIKTHCAQNLAPFDGVH